MVLKVDFFIRTNKNEQIEQQTVLNKGGNVYSGDDTILQDYAVKHNAKNVHAYINALKSSGSADKIIKEYKSKRIIAKRAENALKHTQETIKLFKSYELGAVTAESCGYSLSDLKKRGIIK